MRVFWDVSCENVVCWNALISENVVCMLCGELDEAEKEFTRMLIRNVVSWTAIISGFVQKEDSIDISEEIARRIKLPEDFVAFSGVCSSWRSAASNKKNFRFSSSLVPWLMLPPKEEGNDLRSFFSLSKGMSRQINLPDASGNKCYSSKGGHGYCDVICYKGKFYVIDGKGRITAVDIMSDNAVVDKQIANLPKELLAIDFLEKLYLVESAGKLLVVIRNGVQPIGESYGTYAFQVLEVDLSTNKWSQFKDLGNRTLFLGDNSSFSVEVLDISNIKPNCIYFTNDCQEIYYDHPKGGGKDIGIYNLQDGSVEPYFKSRIKCNLYDPITPPVWVEESFQ
ncbi:hypothetical protein EZV62_022985 [Acer yangbiense]|uniref:KIB1-4 beta-propeller domain-containing protein n=1 Tax=Acer yangbiense TaxID=1000413 RepID=A0A5C7H0W0_9ROSI|nr:hypothetical protein EZV62_022985 [Acer yangbiense]